MEHGLVISLIYNASLLLALGIIFDAVALHSNRRGWGTKLVIGVSLGLIAVAIMINPWILKPGIVFDTRSILFSLIGMFFGAFPAIIATVIAVTYRIIQGGSGVYMGTSVIVASVLWGYVWKRLHHKWKPSYSILEFYTLGVVTHLTMLSLTILLPSGSKMYVFSTIASPVLVIYPLVTVALGLILVRRIELRRERFDLEASEEQFRSLYDNAPMAYQSLDVKGNFVNVNQTWLKTMGYQLEDIVGKNFSELIPAEYQAQFTQCFAKFKADGRIDDVEYGLVKQDGSQILVSFIGKVVTDEAGKFQQTQCVFTDITERRKQETALSKIRADWEAIFQSIPHPTFVLDKDQNVIAANKYLEQAIGLTSEQMKGMQCWELMHGTGSHEPPLGCPFADSCNLDNNNPTEMEVEALNGWYLVSCKPVYDIAGNIDKVIHIAMDITERKKAELILAQSEEKYRLLSETAQDIILVHHMDGSLSYANKRARNFLGIAPEELDAINILDYIAPEYHDMLLQHAAERKQGFTGNRLYALEMISGDKRRIHVEVSSTPIVMNNQITGILAVIRDISDRMADQKAIKDSQERFELFMDNLPGGVFIKDSSSTVLYVNQYLKTIHNADKKVGFGPHDFYPKDVADAVVREDQQTLKTSYRNAVEQILHNDGSTHIYDTTKFLLPNPNGEPLIGGITLDVTQKMLAEEQKNRYAHRIEILRKIDSIVLETLSFDSVCVAAVQNLNLLIPFTVLTINVLVDGKINIHTLFKPDDKYNYLNTEVQYQPDPEFIAELIKSKTIVINDAPNHPQPANMPIRAMMIKDGIQSIMYNAMVVQDELVGFLWFSSEQKDFFTAEYCEIADEFANQLAIVLHQLQLIQKIKDHAYELEVKVEERTKQLKASNTELEAFSYSVAHDLRAPLRTIDGYCNILMEDYAPSLHEHALNLLGTIRTTSQRMDTLIKELLELAKLTRNAIKYSHVDMRKMASHICGDIVEAKAPVTFDVKIDDIPWVTADYALIRQVWQNLLENAVKFTLPCDERRIHIGFQKRGHDTVYYVKDSGVGFDMEYVNKIFDAFQRLHREAEFDGTGIGLAIVKKIIDRHNGQVWAESTLGKGSTIYFSLPDIGLES